MATPSAAITIRRLPLPSSLLPRLSRLLPSFSSLPLSLPPLFISPSHRLSSSSTQSHASPSLLHVSHDLSNEDANLSEPEEEGDELDLEAPQESEPISSSTTLPRLPCPELSIKEKKELASFAHSLGKKLKSQQVGKGGITPSVAAAFVESLESNELLKIKVHGSCPGELSDAIRQLEEATGSVAVGQIGRSVILYRPSLSKMKKKEAQIPRTGWNVRSRKSATTSRFQKRRPESKMPTYGRQ
ncbi:uncharacterized protein [Typha latifolia]|uniref:uncharacterized protein n=1 Tax=Typha latifolia TaxID=4733 RepID=UPI003C2C7F00